jgi:hypothetical protein
LELQGDVGLVEVRFGPLGDGVNLSQDMCTVCTECTTGMEFFWPHPMDLLNDVGQMEDRFAHTQ